MEKQGEKGNAVVAALASHASTHWPKYLAALASASALGLGYYVYYRYNSNELYLLRDYDPNEGARRLAAFSGPANPSLRIRVIDFDGSLVRQTELLEKYKPVILDFKDWGPALRIDSSYFTLLDRLSLVLSYFSSFRLIWKFERALSEKVGSPHDDDNSNRPLVTFYGANDFHHIALPLIRRFRQPFNLVIFDNHPDWFKHYPGLHCGTWFTQAASLPTVSKAFHFGGASHEFDDDDETEHPADLIRSGKISVYPAMKPFSGAMWKSLPQTPLREAWHKVVDENRVRALLEPHRTALAACPLYVTFDKDVLYKTDNMQNWNSGHLSRAEALAVLRVLMEFSNNRLLALDVTGDFSPVDVSGLARRYLHWSQHTEKENNIDPKAALPNNQRSNLELLQTVEDSLSGRPFALAPRLASGSSKPSSSTSTSTASTSTSPKKGSDLKSPLTPTELHTFLVEAIRANDLAKVSVALVTPTLDPGFNNSEAIRLSAELGHTAIVELLLKDARADPSALQNSAVALAAWNGHFETVKTLLRDPRVDPSSKLNYAIRGAADTGSVALVALLLADPRVDPTSMHNFCARTAAEKGFAEVLELLLKDPRVDITDENNYALDTATKKGHTKIVEMIKKHLETKGVELAPKAVKIASPKKGEADADLLETLEVPLAALSPSDEDALRFEVLANNSVKEAESLEVGEAPKIVAPEEPQNEVDEEARKKEIMKKYRKKAVAKFDFTGDAAKEQLSFKKDDIIVILEFDKDEEWWLGELNGVEGFFPKSYTEVLKKKMKVNRNSVSSSIKKTQDKLNLFKGKE